MILDSSLSCMTASRTGVRLMPIICDISTSLKGAPGSKSRDMMFSRKVRYAYCLAVSPCLFSSIFMGKTS